MVRHLAHVPPPGAPMRRSRSRSRSARTIGPALVEPLADALAAEDNAAHRAAAARHPDRVRRRGAPRTPTSCAAPRIRPCAARPSTCCAALGGDAALPDLRGAARRRGAGGAARGAARDRADRHRRGLSRRSSRRSKTRQAAHARRDHAGARAPCATSAPRRCSSTSSQHSDYTRPARRPSTSRRSSRSAGSPSTSDRWRR